jgi:ribose 5-phosphate isomerase
MEDEMNDPNRGTGRTTGLMLQALGNAVMARGADVEFVDHWPHTHHAAHRMKCQIEAMAETLGLLMDVRRDGARVFVRSRISPNAESEASQ